MRDRGQQRGAQPFGFGRTFDAVHLLDQTDALDRERSLIAQSVEEPALIGSEERARLIAVDADHADGAATGMHRQKQALCAGQGVGAAAGGMIVFPSPFRRGEIGVIKGVFGRITGLHCDRSVFWQKNDDPNLQEQRGLISGRPEHIVEGAGAGQFAAEGIKRIP